MTNQNLSVILNGPYLYHSGFSKANREMAFRLSKRGVNVKTEIVDTKVEVDKATEDAVRRLTRTVVPKKTPTVYSMTMPPIISGDGPKVLFTMMESSKEVHKEYAEKMNLATEIWVPTSHMTEALEAAGVCSPVHIVPLGVDTEIFSESSGRMYVPGDTRGFKFLSVSWWGPRKGFDILIKAFVGEFSSSEDVCLVISSRRHDGKASTAIVEDIKNIIRTTGKVSRPPIVLISRVMDEEELASLYNACDAFVLPSRGEGFSLPILEAASCGLPVISTRCTAQATYLDDDNSYLVDPEGFERANPNDGRPSSVGRWCKYYENQLFPVFSGKSVKRLGELMRSVHNDRITASQKARLLTDKVRTTMTWDNAADVFIERLADLTQRVNGGQ